MAATVWGIEYDLEMARVANDQYASVLVGDLESMNLAELLAGQSFDYVILGDVLEHLRDPERTLKRLLPFVKVGGATIISVPNMQHVSAIYQLVVKGYWPSNDRGIFDRTHLRVITRKNVVEMIRNSGLELRDLKRVFRFRDRLGSRFPIYGRLLKLVFPDYYTFQYVALAVREK